MGLKLPATCGESYDLWPLEAYLKCWREGCQQVAESRNVLEVLRFILNIHVNASSNCITVLSSCNIFLTSTHKTNVSGTCTCSPVALKASKALSFFEEHRTRKRSSFSISFPRQFLGSCLGSPSSTRTNLEDVFLQERCFSLPSQEAPPHGARMPVLLFDFERINYFTMYVFLYFLLGFYLTTFFTTHLPLAFNTKIQWFQTDHLLRVMAWAQSHSFPIACTVRLQLPHPIDSYTLLPFMSLFLLPALARVPFINLQF